MATHLDPAAGRTTSGVKRYLNFAISSMASDQGRLLCGPRTGPQFDMDALIRAGGTVYLLAEVDEMELARPLLTMLAGEMFMSAERTARTMPGRRLPHTFMGVFDASPTEATGRSPETRRVLREMDSGTVDGR